MSPSKRLYKITEHLEVSSSDPARLDDQVVLITGAAQGIGKAAAQLFARQGAKLMLSDLDGTKLDETIEELTSAGADAYAIAGDVLDPHFAERYVSAALTRYGKVNCLVNNAGFCFDSAIHKMTDEKFDIIMRAHNHAPFRLIRALSTHWMDPLHREMPKTIVNVSSTSGLHGSMGQINYATAKAGVVGLTKTVASEWGRYNVRANAVAYGWIDTRITQPPDNSKTINIDSQEVIPGIPLNAKKWRDISDIPLGRVGTVEDAAKVMLFLASPLSSYVTGTCVECTGGRFM